MQTVSCKSHCSYTQLGRAALDDSIHRLQDCPFLLLSVVLAVVAIHGLVHLNM